LLHGRTLTAPPAAAKFDNVRSRPHCIAWTDELFATSADRCRGMLDLAAGRVPKGRRQSRGARPPGFQAKWKRILSQQE